LPPALSTVFAASLHSPVHLDFGYLFTTIREPEHLLPETPATFGALVNLGKAMVATQLDEGSFSNIPSGYAYLGQFIAHDVTLFDIANRTTPPSCDFSANLSVDAMMDMVASLVNKRGAQLQLDSIYNDVRMQPDGIHVALGALTPAITPGLLATLSIEAPQKADEFLDVPRNEDRSAAIGDPRNDNNVVVSQLHVGFLRAHNVIVDRLLAEGVAQNVVFVKAQKTLRQHYHHLLIHDFLKLVCDENVVDEVLNTTNPLCNPEAQDFCLPLEFTVAAYRFGHSLIASRYYYNDIFPVVAFNKLIPRLMMKVNGQDVPTLPDTSTIDWKRFLSRRQDHTEAPNLTRLIVPAMISQQSHILDDKGNELECQANLAVMDLLRGYFLRLPTGQAVAKAIRDSGRDIRVLTKVEIEENAGSRSADLKKNISDPQFGFSERTPLWYYILAEAEVIHGGNCLGPVGSTIVAEVLIALVRRSADPILPKVGNDVSEISFTPFQTDSGKFGFADLLRLAKVMA